MATLSMHAEPAIVGNIGGHNFLRLRFTKRPLENRISLINRRAGEIKIIKAVIGAISCLLCHHVRFKLNARRGVQFFSPSRNRVHQLAEFITILSFAGKTHKDCQQDQPFCLRKTKP